MALLASRINGKIYTHIFLVVYLCLHFGILKYIYNLTIGIAILDTVSFGLIIYGLIYVLALFRNARAEGAMQILNLIIQNLLISALFVFGYNWVVEVYFPQEALYLEVLHDTVFLRGLIVWTLLSNFTVVQFIIKDQQNEQLAKEKTLYNEQLMKDAELFKLRQQINPHFLFNSLNSINALITISPERSREMLLQLSQYFRNAINKEDQQLINIQEEINDIQLYFEIEKVRFGHRLTLETEIDEACLQHQAPAFLLQPLVENAIKYGLYGTTDAVAIRFRLFYTTSEAGNKYVSFEISNPFESNTTQVSGTGFALNAIRRRLYLLYGRNDLLVTKITAVADSPNRKIYTAYISIPLFTPLNS